MKDSISTADLMVALLLGLPAFWFLGVDQLIWWALIPWALWRLRRRPLNDGSRPLVILICLFLLSQMISLRNLDNPMRLLTFARNWLTDAAGLLVFLTVLLEPMDEAGFKRVIKAVGICGGIISLLGLLGLILPVGFSFEAPSRFLFPASVKHLPSVLVHFQRQLITLDWWRGDIQPRVHSVFGHATSYALALLVFIPVQAYWLGDRRMPGRIWAGLAFGASAIGLCLSFTRSAWVGLFVGVVIALGMCAFRFLRGKWGMAAVLLLVASLSCLGAATVVAGFGLDPGARSGMQARGGRDSPLLSSNAFLNARGSGSLVDRSAIYEATLLDWMLHPWIGWATQRSILEDKPYPAGSHSTYLGVLYKHGALGLLLLLLIYLQLGSRLFKRAFPSGGPVSGFHLACWISFCAAAFHQVFEELDLDAITFMVFWLVMAVALKPEVQAPASSAPRATPS